MTILTCVLGLTDQAQLNAEQGMYPTVTCETRRDWKNTKMWAGQTL